MTRRHTRLEVSPLEDRVTPVIGGLDTPFVADTDDVVSVGAGTSNLTGVVDINGASTGALLDRSAIVVGSRHILTAAHNAPNPATYVPNSLSVTFYRRLGDGNLQQVSIPIESVWVDPAYTGTPTSNVGDVALLTLAAIAPFGVTDYPIYTSANASASSEVTKPFILAGYGRTGTGLSGQSVAQELQRMTVTATTGSFSIRRPDTGQTSAPITWDLNSTTQASREAAVAAALASIGLPAQVRQVAVAAPIPPGTPITFELLFTSNANLRRMSATTLGTLFNGGNEGTVTFATLVNGGINPEIQRLTVAASGGTYRLGYTGPNAQPTFTVPIPFNATPAQVQAALETVLIAVTPPNNVNLNPPEVTVRRMTTGPNAGSYEITFDGLGIDISLLAVDASSLAGTAVVSTIMDGGKRALRVGANEYDSNPTGTGVLASDFGSDGTDTFPGSGDDGGPGFIASAGGGLAIASVVSYTPAAQRVFNQPGAPTNEFDTRISKYSADILNEAAGLRLVGGVLIQQQDAVTLDMQYQSAGFDSVADTITVTQTTVSGTPVVQIWVQSTGGAKNLYYQAPLAGISTVRLVGTTDDETFVIDPSVTKFVNVNGGGGNDTLIGSGAQTDWTLLGAGQGKGHTAPADFSFQNISNVTGGAGDDTFTFAAGGSLAGRLDGGGGTDSLDFSQEAGTVFRLVGQGVLDGFAGTVAPIAGGFVNVNKVVGNANAGVDVLVGADTPAVFFHNGTSGIYTIAGRSLSYENLDSLVGGAAADTFNVLAVTAPLAIAGGAGDDVVNVAADAPANAADGGPVNASLTVDGGPGTDLFRFNGTSANEAVTARVSAPGAGDVLGLTPTPGVTVAFTTLEQFLFDGRGGTNSFVAQDVSNTSLGTPTDPGSGVVYYPTGATGGNARINGVTVGATGINNGFTVNGDPDGSGDRDVLLVVGTSAPGLVSSFGEAVVGDGRDLIDISDTTVTFTSVVAGPLLPVRIGYTPGGSQAFSTLYVAGGNEGGNEGDTITVPTTLTFNLVADGMLPSATIRPGDRVVVSAPGGGDAQLVTDPSRGPTQVRVTARSDGSSAGLLGFESGTPPAAGVGMLAVGTDAGVQTLVRVFDRVTGALRYEVSPFPDSTSGVKVASGDVNGDGVADLVVGSGQGGGPRVAVYDGITGAQLFDFFGYEDTFRGGVTVAVGDVNLDGFGDLILGTGVGGAPRVRVLSGRDLTPLRDAFAYESSFRGGVSVAAGDVNGDGVPDLITSTGDGGGPRVVILDGRTAAQLGSFFVFDPNTRVGFSAASGDVNGDGFADIVVGSGAGFPAQVRVFSGINRAVVDDFYVNDPFDPALRTSSIGAAVRVAVSDVDGDGVGDVITGLGPGGDAVIRTYKVTGVIPPTNALFPTLQEIRRQDAFDVGYGFGVFVGASD